MDSATLALVRSRGQDRCEYCGALQIHFVARFHVEHIIAKQYGGADDDSNLALACDRRNAFKGPNLSPVDPTTGNVVALFHPRKDAWHDHFNLQEDGQIFGMTDVGRATVRLLNMNAHYRVVLRREIADHPS
jgi:hypothetical protein